MRPLLVALCGTSQSTDAEDELGFTVGRLCADKGVVGICGGLGGIMSSAAKGMTEAGGTCIGLLPGSDANEGNEYLSYSLPTGLGEMRNGLVARAAAGMVAIGGGYGTLSEISLARRLDKPVVCLGSWSFEAPDPMDDPGVYWSKDPEDAMEWLWRQLEA